VRSRVRPVDAACMAAGPNALRGSGPNPTRAFEDALTPAGSPDPPERSCLHYVVVPSPIPYDFLPAVDSYAAGNNFGSLNRSPCTIMAQAIRAISLAKCNGSNLDWPTVHQTGEPKPFCAVLARIADDCHRSGDEQPAQMSNTLLRDPAESLFAAGRMLSRHQPDPRSETAARREHPPISHLGH
jgi:hypothetical protein